MKTDGDFKPQFTDESILAIARMYRPYNEVNIFVEDEGKSPEYETIFERLLSNKYAISRIFEAKGKNRVKLFYEKLKENRQVNNIFIVDGDYDEFKEPAAMIIDDRFIYLEMYNIENYLVDEHACCTYVKTKIEKMYDDVRSKIKFNDWYKRIIEESKDLFLCYLYVQITNPQLENVSRKHGLFIDEKTGFKRKDKNFIDYIEQVKSLDPNYDEGIQKLKRMYEKKYGNDYSRLICGKFLLYSLRRHLANTINKKFSDKELRWWLVCNFDVEKLSFIRDRIAKCVDDCKLRKI